MMHRANRLMSAVLPLMILPVLLNAGCGSSKYTVTFSDYTLPFVTVREADFRCGPLDLPLTAESRRKISTFLQRGGNWGNDEMHDFNTPTYYEKLLDLLSDPKFLHSGNFRQEEDLTSKILILRFSRQPRKRGEDTWQLPVNCC